MKIVAFFTLEHPAATPSGGIASYIRAIAPALEQYGWKAIVISLQAADPALPSIGFRTFVARSSSWHWYLSKVPVLGKIFALPLREWEWAKAFHRGLSEARKAMNIDLIETHELSARYLRGSGIPFVLRLHGSTYVYRRQLNLSVTISMRWSHRIVRNACLDANAVTTPSESYRIASLEGVEPSVSVRVIPNPASTGILDKGKDNHPPDYGIVLVLGRIASAKGFSEEMFQSLLILTTRSPATQVVLAGPWQMEFPPEHYGIKFGSLLCSDSIIWIGPIDRAATFDLLGRTSLMLIASRYESFGITALEGMAFGIPVVAFDAGGLPEVIGGPKNGVLIENGNYSEFIDASCKLMRDPEERRRLGQAGRARVQSLFTPGRVAEETVRMYNEILDRKEVLGQEAAP
ncbi:MAG: glycosyltransferase family 4 protein [Bacteroidota bacterium]